MEDNHKSNSAVNGTVEWKRVSLEQMGAVVAIDVEKTGVDKIKDEAVTFMSKTEYNWILSVESNNWQVRKLPVVIVGRMTVGS